MLSMRFPFLLVVFFLLWSSVKIAPFLLLVVAAWFLLGVVARQGYRFEPAPTVSEEQLAELRNDVAIGLLDVDDDMRLKTNSDARSRFEAAGRYYTRASRTLDRGVRRRDRDAVARTLYRARYELEATAAALEGRTLPEEPVSPPSRQQVMVAAPRSRERRRSRQRRHSYCGW